MAASVCPWWEDFCPTRLQAILDDGGSIVSLSFRCGRGRRPGQHLPPRPLGPVGVAADLRDINRLCLNTSLGFSYTEQ